MTDKEFMNEPKKLPEITGSKDQLKCLIGAGMRTSQAIMYLEHLEGSLENNGFSFNQADKNRLCDALGGLNSALQKIDFLAQDKAKKDIIDEQTSVINAILQKPESNIIVP